MQTSSESTAFQVRLRFGETIRAFASALTDLKRAFDEQGRWPAGPEAVALLADKLLTMETVVRRVSPERLMRALQAAEQLASRHRTAQNSLNN